VTEQGQLLSLQLAPPEAAAPAAPWEPHVDPAVIEDIAGWLR
jgi:hypothetical protein